MNDWQKHVLRLQRLLRELPLKPNEDADISAFETLEREISGAVDSLYAGRLENAIRSVAERAPTLESLEKIEGEIQALFQQVHKKKLADVETTRFWSLLNHTGDGFLTADATTGRILDANETIASWLGYARDDLLQLHVQDVDESLPLIPSEGWSSWIREVESGTEPFQAERELRRQDGRRFPVELSVVHRNVENQSCLVFFARDITERKDREEQLREQVTFLGRLLDDSVDGILAFDMDCILSFCTPSLERFLGVNKSELLGKKAWDALPFLEDLGEDLYFYEAIDGKKVTSRNRDYTIPGSERRVTFDIHYSPLLNESGKVVGGVAVVRDMTGQRETERARDEARQELDAQQSQLNSLHNAERERLEQALEEAQQELGSQKSRLEETHGEVQKILEREIGELKATKETLRESEEVLSALVDSIPDSVITVNRDGQIVFFNRAWPVVDEEQNGAADFYRMIRPECHEAFRNGLERVFRTRERETLELVAASGASYESRLVPLLREESMVGALILSTETVTKVEPEPAEESKPILQARPEQGLENLTVVAGGVVRDYDELLTDMLGHAGSVIGDLPPDSTARYSLEQIETAALRATELTEQLQDYAETDLINARLLDLGRLVDEMTHEIEMSVHPDALFDKQTSDTALPIRADAGQVRQLVLNLVRNASEALGQQEGIVTVSTGAVDASRADLSDCFLGEDLPEGSYAYLEVSDTGQGMDDDTLARALVPFFTTKASGDGLGLARVVGTARRHHGAIRIQSTPQHGTAVRVLFPQHGLREVTVIEDKGRSWANPE